MSIEDLKMITEELKWSALQPPAEFKHTINIDGVDYSLVPEFNKLTVGEWIDIDSNLENLIPNMHQIMAILYRPLISAINDRTRIVKDYDANECLENSKIFKEKMMIGDVYGAALFFFCIGTEFTKNLSLYLQEGVQKETMIYEESLKRNEEIV
jgi:hypothetical protein